MLQNQFYVKNLETKPSNLDKKIKKNNQTYLFNETYLYSKNSLGTNLVGLTRKHEKNAHSSVLSTHFYSNSRYPCQNLGSPE